MDKELNSEFSQTRFSPEVVDMFKKILAKDDIHRKILRYIAMGQAEKMNVSIMQLMENITTERRVKIQNKKTYNFVIKESLLDRKYAERVVDKLASMSLLYYEHMAPYKHLFITHRGLQVLKSLEENKTEEKRRDE